ncbi:MAG: VCBS repeat-containing protein [Myxococcales bacterium]|nr:VCBS repeat-containing protein [Myxococcales bacterium]
MTRPCARSTLLLTVFAIALMVAMPACGDSGSGADEVGTTGITEGPEGSGSGPESSDSGDTGSSSDGTGSSSSDSSSSSSSSNDGGTKFDMAPLSDADVPPPPPSCKVIDDMNAVGQCRESAPPDSFEPDTQWSYTGPAGFDQAIATPLVVNLTDDDQNGEIDLCDIPDVILVAGPKAGDTRPSKMLAIDGETGTVHFEFAGLVQYAATPALGDIDNDGLPEIISVESGSGGRLLAFEHDGPLKWTSNTNWTAAQSSAIAMADLDADGDVEIVTANLIFDHTGTLLQTLPVGSAGQWGATTMADLDDDGDLEVVVGRSAYHHDGTPLFINAQLGPGHAHVANLDDDPEPEILVSGYSGVTVLEHDGTVKYLNAKPGGTSPSFRPAAIHDFDGDEQAEFAVSSSSVYSVYETTPSVLWSAAVTDASGWSGGTAFDFDGDGVAEAMYADEANLFIFNGAGVPLLTVPRSARTLAEYPVVADVDNDGSAEIIVVSDAGFANNQTAPTVQVIRDVEDRWIQARRIWNQHTYHVTNVREDGTIPQFEPPNWESLNTFRTNAQIEGGSICMPDPQG